MSERIRKIPSPLHVKSRIQGLSNIDVDNFRSLCIGSPIPAASHHDINDLSHSKINEPGVEDNPSILDYSNYSQDKLLENSEITSPRCPSITVDSNITDFRKDEHFEINSLPIPDTIPEFGNKLNAESGAVSPANGDPLSPLGSLPSDGLAPRSPLQRRATNNSRYVTYHRADLRPPSSGLSNRLTCTSETIKTIQLSTTGKSKGHTRADTYPPPKHERAGSENISDSMSPLSNSGGFPLFSLRSGSNNVSSTLPGCSTFPVGRISPTSGPSTETKFQDRKRGHPAKLAPLDVKVSNMQ